MAVPQKQFLEKDRFSVPKPQNPKLAVNRIQDSGIFKASANVSQRLAERPNIPNAALTEVKCFSLDQTYG